MACDCASNFKESFKKQDQEIQKIINQAQTSKNSYPVKRVILFLIDIINSGKKKEKNSTVAIVREEKVEPINKKELIEPESNEEDEENGKEDNLSKGICFAYKFGKCPHKDGIGCQNRHPIKCQEFCDFGHKAVDEKGCETQKCQLLHPKLCRNSTKYRKCYHRQCRFQHLKGTKTVPKREFDNARSVNESGKSENCDFINEKLDKLIDLIKISIQINQDRKT